MGRHGGRGTLDLSPQCCVQHTLSPEGTIFRVSHSSRACTVIPTLRSELAASTASNHLHRKWETVFFFLPSLLPPSPFDYKHDKLTAISAPLWHLFSDFDSVSLDLCPSLLSLSMTVSFHEGHITNFFPNPRCSF